MQLIIDRLRYLVAENLDVGVEAEDIDPNAQLLDGGLKLDSLSIVKLIGLSEQEFRMEFGEDDMRMETFANLRSLAGVIAVHSSMEQSKSEVVTA